MVINLLKHAHLNLNLSNLQRLAIWASFVLGMVCGILLDRRRSCSSPQITPTVAPSYSCPDCFNYTRCHYFRTPYVATLLESAQSLLATNNSLARFGNGDFDLILGKSQKYQTAHTNLSSALRRVLESNLDNLSIGVPDVLSGASETNRQTIQFWESRSQYKDLMLKSLHMNKQYLNAFISAANLDVSGTYCSIIPEVYNTLRTIWRGKDIILVRGNNGEEYKYDVYDTANSIEEIVVPGIEAWDVYLPLKDRLVSSSPSRLIILAAGPVSKVLAYDLAEKGHRALDLGHLAKDYNAYMSGYIPPDFWVVRDISIDSK